MLSDSYIQYVESLTLESPEIYGDQGPGESSSRRRSNPSGWGSRPGYNSGHELGKTLFSGTIGDAEEGVVPLVEELARSKGETVAEVAAEAENPYTGDLRSANPHFSPGDLVRIYHGPDNVSKVYKVVGPSGYSEQGNHTYLLEGITKTCDYGLDQFEALAAELLAYDDLSKARMAKAA
jgi:hypothetical protein